MADMETSAVVRVVDRATPEIRKINRSLDRLRGNIRKAGRDGRGMSRMSRAMTVFSGRTEIAVRKTNRLRASMRALGRVAGRASLAVSKSFAAIGRGMKKFALFGSAGALIGGGALYGATKWFVTAAAEMENYRVQLAALEGDQKKANAALEWILDFAQRTPLELPQVIEAYAKLKAFGIDPMNGSLQALVDTMAFHGKGMQFLEGEILALGKAWTKGKLQGEEVMMLMEKGIPVYKLLAKAMKKPEKAIADLVSKDKVGRREIAMLIALMAKRAKGASKAMSKTWQGMVRNIGDYIWNFRRMVGEAGPLPVLKEKLQGVLDVLDRMKESGAFKRLADSIGKGLGKVLDAIIPDMETIERVVNRLSSEEWFSEENIKGAIEGIKSLKAEFSDTLATIKAAIDATQRLLQFLGLMDKTHAQRMREWRADVKRKAALEGDRTASNRRKVWIRTFGTPAKDIGMMQATREMKGDLMPGFKIPEAAGISLGKRTADGIIISKDTIGTAIGNAVADSVRARAAEIGTLMGQSVAAQIRQAVQGITVTPNVAMPGPRRPLQTIGPRAKQASGPTGADMPAPLASQ